MGSRSADNSVLTQWVKETGDRASGGTLADAAAFGEIVVNCTAGLASMAALEAAGANNLADKVIIDVANPVIASGRIEPPTLDIVNIDSLGERIQRRYPASRVVKTLNTINFNVMVNPALVPGEHVVFVSGDDQGAKDLTAALLGEFGWPAERIVDLGDITTARGTEMYIALYSRLFLKFRHVNFSISIVKDPDAVPILSPDS
jgi:predicted dinucleotide-binding enzyme